MYFVVLGAGEVGLKVAQILSVEGHEVVVIEKEKSRVSHIYNKIDCRLIINEGTKSEALINADIQRADYFIAVTNSDETNLITCILVRAMAPHVKNVARLRNKEYMQNSQQIESVFPVDYVVHPERETALSIIRSIEYGSGTSDVFTFKNFGDIMMRNYFIDSGSIFIGLQLKELSQKLNISQHLFSNFLITLINRKDEAIIPTGDSTLIEGDEIFVVGKKNILEELFVHLGKNIKSAKNIRKIIIIGASAVAAQIIDCYINTRYNKLSSIIGKRRFTSREITVIDEDLQQCKDFAEQYPEITVLHADITDEDVLEDLEISQAGMLIATTNVQERNIVLAAHSHNLGLAHTIALVRSPVFFNIAAELGIGISLSVRSAVVSSITSFLRGETALYSLLEGSYGVFECQVNKSSAVVHKKVSTITMPQKSLILCTSNVNGSIISNGNTIIQLGDRVLCLAHPDSIEHLHNLFSPTDKEPPMNETHKKTLSKEHTQNG